MPPTCKKRGRPLGSKNKKSKQHKQNKNDKALKTNYAIVRNVKVLKTEKPSNESDLKFICTICNEVIKTTNLQQHVKQCCKKTNVDVDEQDIIQVTWFKSILILCLVKNVVTIYL